MLANVFYVSAAFLLVLLNGFLVAAELELVKLRYTQAVGLAAGRGWRGEVLLSVHARLDSYLWAFRLGITLSSLGLGWIVGDIADDHRNVPAMAYQRAARGSFTVSGSLPIYRLERMLDREIEAPGEANSVGGLIIHRLERLPTEGETLAFKGFTLTVSAMRGAKAHSITVCPTAEKPDHRSRKHVRDRYHPRSKHRDNGVHEPYPACPVPTRWPLRRAG